jgi:hypothetical protein
MKKRGAPNYRNKSEQVADALMSRIIDGGLKPGDMHRGRVDRADADECAGALLERTRSLR